MMKVFVGVSLAFGLALLGLGSAITCYKCETYSGSCTNTQECRFDDACLKLTERNGRTYRQCVKYSECDSTTLGQMFPTVSSLSFSCCKRDLCNGASVPTAATSFLGLLLSLAAFWWCVL